MKETLGPETLPTPGYRLLDVSAAYQQYTILDPDAEREEPLGQKENIRLLWDWRIVGDRRFEVFLGVLMTGTIEEPQEVDVRLVGTFAVDGETPALGINVFVHTSAPAILLPYIREKITKLTGDGPFEAFWLPIVNVQSLMDSGVYPYDDSTGAKQLAEDPDALEKSEDHGEKTE